MATVGRVQWLNDNTGAVQGLSTVVLVLVTAISVILTSVSLRRQRKDRRPYVSLSVVYRQQSGAHLQIQNHGDRAAEQVTFQIHSEPDGLQLATAHGPLSRGIRYLAPGQCHTLDNELDTPRDRRLERGEKVIDVAVEYRNGRDRYRDRICLDLSDIYDVLLSSWDDGHDRIADAVLKVARSSRSNGPRWTTTRRRTLSDGVD